MGGITLNGINIFQSGENQISGSGYSKKTIGN
jgi:hypothetical protein